MQLEGMCCGDSRGSWKGEMGCEYDLFHSIQVCNSQKNNKLINF